MPRTALTARPLWLKPTTRSFSSKIGGWPEPISECGIGQNERILVVAGDAVQILLRYEQDRNVIGADTPCLVHKDVVDLGIGGLALFGVVLRDQHFHAVDISLRRGAIRP